VSDTPFSAIFLDSAYSNGFYCTQPVYEPLPRLRVPVFRREWSFRCEPLDDVETMDAIEFRLVACDPTRRVLVYAKEQR
jgi:hypothetical protein